MLSLTLAVVVAAAPKLAIPDFTGVNLAPNEATLFSNTLAAEFSRGGLDVVTSRDLATLLGLERQRQLMGCAESGCIAELVGALGADAIVQGDVGRLEDVYVVQLKVLSTQHAQVLALFSGRVSRSTELPAMLERAAVELQNQLAAKWNRPELVRAGAPARFSSSGGTRWVAYLVGGVGLAALATGVGLNIWADNILLQLQLGTRSAGDLKALADQGKGVEAAGFAFVGVGGAALVAGTVLFFVLAPEAPAAVSMTPLPGGGLVAFQGVWP
ncbi:MAG: hypothetical protein SFW67_36420 [Myxococcaceae bacterium]|nr:hypothetical protein [Myxococcaceae bacterium]